MNDPDLFFLHALLCGEQGRRPVFPAKEAAERAFAPRAWEEIVELFQRPVPGLYKRAAIDVYKRQGLQNRGVGHCFFLPEGVRYCIIV